MQPNENRGPEARLAKCQPTPAGVGAKSKRQSAVGAALIPTRAFFGIAINFPLKTRFLMTVRWLPLSIRPLPAQGEFPPPPRIPQHNNLLGKLRERGGWLSLTVFVCDTHAVGVALCVGSQGAYSKRPATL